MLRMNRNIQNKERVSRCARLVWQGHSVTRRSVMWHYEIMWHRNQRVVISRDVTWRCQFMVSYCFKREVTSRGHIMVSGWQPPRRLLNVGTLKFERRPKFGTPIFDQDTNDRGLARYFPVVCIYISGTFYIPTYLYSSCNVTFSWATLSRSLEY